MLHMQPGSDTLLALEEDPSHGISVSPNKDTYQSNPQLSHLVHGHQWTESLASVTQLTSENSHRCVVGITVSVH